MLVYSNQTGGTACFQDEEEGVLAPVYNGPINNESEIRLEAFLSEYLFEI